MARRSRQRQRHRSNGVALQTGREPAGLILLVRHPPAAIGPGICYGRLDLDLAEPASRFARQFGGFQGTIWTSPARRCRLVAEAIGPHRVEPRLQELSFGRWEGLRWDDVPRDEIDAWAGDLWHAAPHGGESGAALAMRVRAFHRDLPKGDHLIVTHGGVLKVLGPLLLGKPIDLSAPSAPLGSVTRYGTA